jgi:hypothetical protein
MALIRGWRFLDSARINRIVRTLADELEAIGARNLIALQRTPVVNADDNEIVGKFKGQFVAADVISDDQEAAVYDTVGQFEFVATEIPNLKLGSRVSQHMINRLARLRQNISGANDVRYFTDWENTLAESLVTGVRQRMNALICAMWLDASSYDRYGIKLTNASWGTPAPLKANAAVAWTVANYATATPITDILALANTVAPDTYGETYNRITMSSKAFRYILKTAEYQSLMGGELRFDFRTAGIDGTGGTSVHQGSTMNMNDFGMHRQMVANLLGMELELYDGVFYERGNNGARTQVRYIPENKIVLSNSNDDNDASAMDFANGVVTESVVSPIIGSGGIGGEAFGPIAYFTGNENLNPPDIVAWGVARGFPRKHRETATAVITATSLGS